MTDESVFAAALDIPDPTERAAYLDRACAGRPALRREVEELLIAHAADNPLDQPPADLCRTGAYEPPAERPGASVGPYKLLQEIGEGGMGTVFMAEQQEPVRRKVALKIIKPGMDSRQVVARFEAERQALSMMDHPNIAKVLDAATTAGGRPFFVMELVHGVPITEFCDAHQLSPRQRLELFVPVCQAIQHAHQKGIIHRDIKPGNILVTMYDDRPVPKVIDFGVAKAVEQRLTERTLFTQFGALVGTFEYMSPEQAEMNAFGVDTRSDVYSLGVLLYELLTGTTPLERQRLRGAALDEVVRLIKEEEPPRPSLRLGTSGTLAHVAAARRTEPVKLSALVRGELDWIVMRCLEKDRTRRYDTASALARDVERYLHDEPVEACPPSAAYRLRKLGRRHKKALATATAFVLLLVLGVLVSTWQAVRATVAEREARAAQARAEIDRDRAEKAEAQAKADRDKAEDERKVAQEQECYWYGLLGTEQGDYTSAETLLNRSLSSARARVGLGAIQTQQIAWALGNLYGRMKTPEKGEPLLRELRDFQRQHGQAESLPAPYATTLEVLGRLLLQERKWAEAEAVLRESLTLREKLGFFQQYNRSITMSLLGASLVGQKKYAEAEPYLLQGYQGLKEASDWNRAREPKVSYPFPEAAERIVQLYEQWGKSAEAAKWRQEWEAAKAAARFAAVP